MEQVFSINDIVAYGTTGLCRIEDIRKETFPGLDEVFEYYILRPISTAASTVHVPVKNKKLTDRMRRLLTKEEIDALLEEIQNEPVCWIEDKTKREETIRAALGGGVQKDLIRVIRDLSERKKHQLSIGRKLHTSDELALGNAKRIVAEEFAYVLGLEPENVADYILARIVIEK